jgi:isoquinoline 1-oxidoreductase beta subunit
MANQAKSESRATSESRRAFLQASAAAGGGLVIGCWAPALARFGAVHGAAPVPFQPNAYLRIAPDNTITVIVGVSEMGQGVLTSIPQLVAEELDADWAQMRFEQAPADPAYINPGFKMQATGGSSSVRSFWEPMRRAGAAARAMLIAAAADTWQVSAADCHAASGFVTHASGKKLSYGQLASRAATMPVPTEVKLKNPKEFKLLGRGLKRLDTHEKVNGSGRFGIDVRLPGLLVAVVAHPPKIGAKVASFNADKARAIAGVRQVVQIDSGVAVVADGYWNAKRGREALEIQWQEPAGVPLSSAAISQALAEHCDTPGFVARHDGDVAAAQPAKTLEAVYEAPYLAHACMEPLNCTAWVKGDTLEVWSSTQAPGPNQMALAKVAGVDPAKCQVHTMLLGGGFGRRFADDFAVAAVQISRAVHAPVKLLYAREDDMKAQHYRPASVLKIKGGLDAAGNPQLLQARVACSSIMVAAGFSKGGTLDSTAVEGLVNWPYDTPNVAIEWSQYEPGVGVWFWRSVGNSQNSFFAESFIDEMAHAAGKDPFEYRRGLLSKHPRHRGVLELAAQKAGWGQPLPAGRARGIAVADSFGSFVAEVAEVSLEKDGPRVHRVVCAMDCGMTVNPEIIRRQVQSSVIFGLSAALYGQITLKDGGVEQNNFNDYLVVRMSEAPRIEVHIMPSEEAPSGVGEPGTPPLAPAVANALFALTGERIRRLPFKGQNLRG